MAGAKRTERRLGIIGAGNMAEALVRGLLAAEVFAPAEIAACDPSPVRQAAFRELGISAAADPRLAASCPAVLLAVKPPAIPEAAAAAAPHLAADPLVVSIAAGINTRHLAACLPPTARIVRVMPNTPMLVRCGAAAVCAGPGARPDDVAEVIRWFGSCGLAIEAPEEMFDAVTAISGSGPAYVFFFAEALQEAAERLGMPPPLARQLTTATVAGAGALLRHGEQSGESSAVLRQRVTSPGGTTEAALKVLTAGGFKAMITAAAEAACRRSAELGATGQAPKRSAR